MQNETRQPLTGLSFVIGVNKVFWVDVDPESMYLKEVELDLSIKDLVGQLQNSPFVSTQLLAVEFLSKNGSLQAFEALVDKLRLENTFWGVKKEIIKVLNTFADSLSQPVFIEFARHSNTKLRAAAFGGMNKLASQTCFEFLLSKVSDESSYKDSNLAPATAIVSLGSVAANLALFGDGVAMRIAEDFLQAFLLGKDKLADDKLSWNQTLEESALKALAKMSKSTSALATLIDFCKPGVEHNLRASAIALLGLASKNRTDGEVGMILDVLQNQFDQDWMFFELAVVNALAQVPGHRAVNMLTKMSQKTNNGRVKLLAEKAKDRVVLSMKPNKNYLELQKEVQKMQKENLELKLRLDKLEAKSGKA